MKKLFIAAIAVIITAIMVFSLASCSVLKPLPKNETLGEALRNGGYELEWEDDFESDSIDATRWRVGLNDPLRRAGYYVKDLAFVEDSNLIIRTEYRENGEYGKGWYTSWVESGITRGHTSASLGSEEYKGYATKYGYFEARCKAPKASGIWSAFWMMPEEGVGMTNKDELNTGRDGVEIDIMESPFYGSKEKNQVIHVVHGDGYGDNLKSDRSAAYRVPKMYDEYHTYGVMWTEDEYIFFIDGRETYRTKYVVDGKELGVSSVSEYLLLTVEIAGENDGNGNLFVGKQKDGKGGYEPHWAGDPEDNDKSKQYDFAVDYVRVYKKK